MASPPPSSSPLALALALASSPYHPPFSSLPTPLSLSLPLSPLPPPRPFAPFGFRFLPRLPFPLSPWLPCALTLPCSLAPFSLRPSLLAVSQAMEEEDMSALTRDVSADVLDAMRLVCFVMDDRYI